MAAAAAVAAAMAARGCLDRTDRAFVICLVGGRWVGAVEVARRDGEAEWENRGEELWGEGVYI